MFTNYTALKYLAKQQKSTLTSTQNLCLSWHSQYQGHASHYFLLRYMQPSIFDAWPQIGESLAHYIYRSRKKLGLSRAKLACKAALHPKTLSRIEHGQTLHLSPRIKKSLAIALEIPVEHLEALNKS